jgi:predicted TIM-barrel fold metal-dependent hydrolase
MIDISIIDAHHHFWDLSLKKHPWLDGRHKITNFRYGDYSNICKNYLLDDYQNDWARHKIIKSVYVETEWDPTDPAGESNWVQNHYEAFGFPNAFVGQIWFEDENVDNILSAHKSFPITRSVRQKPQSTLSFEEFKPNLPGSMGDPKFRAGYKHLLKHGLHYDLQTPWWHLGEAALLARDFPDTVIILNHTGLPSDRSKLGIDRWRSAIQEFALQPNTAVKLSGIGIANEPWHVEENELIIKDTIMAFGPDRCMFGSNFPVDGLCNSFDTIFQNFKNITSTFSKKDQSALFHDNAVKYYHPLL